MDVQRVLKMIRQNRKSLTRQQVRVLKGQALAGDPDGAVRGLLGILSLQNTKAYVIEKRRIVL